MTATMAAIGLPAFEPGTVWLAGAGPGDPGLLTRLAAHGLAEADVVAHDALVAPEILSLAGPHTVLENVGKRAGGAKTEQAMINRRLVVLATRGLRVLRLKGGDPFVFGRGGEEALALANAGVPFRVVPGVTAGIGGLATAGIPVTQRGINTVVSLVTGHDRSGQAPGDVDWAALARSSPVIVLYMALATIGDVARQLMAAGRAPGTPVAVVSKATGPSQSVLRTDLARVAGDIVHHRVKGPAVIAVGEVARLHDSLAPWQQSGDAAAQEAAPVLPEITQAVAALHP